MTGGGKRGGSGRTASKQTNLEVNISLFRKLCTAMEEEEEEEEEREK